MAEKNKLNGLESRFSHSDPQNSDNMHSGDFLGNLNSAIRDNPLPAAMIGMGILWMFAGGRKTSVGEAMTGRGARTMINSLARGAEKAGDSVLHGVGRVGSSVADLAHGSVDTLTGAAGQVRRVLTPSSGDDVHDGFDSHGYGDAHRGVKNDYLHGGLLRSLSALFEQRPLVLGAAGLALGAGIAASLPVSGAEQQAFGGASDHLWNKIQDVTDQAKNLATAAVDEVEAQGRDTHRI